MAEITWPVTLPCAPLVGTLRRAFVDRKAEFTPDYGGRPATGIFATGTTWRISCTVALRYGVQFIAWETFYETTLKNGSKRFKMDNAITYGVELNCKFIGEPPEAYDSGSWRRIYLPIQFVGWIST